jgi:type IV pilus assembly protein PilF
MKKHAVLLGLVVATFLLSSCGRSPKSMEEGDLHFQASKTLHSKGESIQSLTEAHEAEKADPKNEEVQNFLGLLYAERNDMEKAKNYMERAIKLKPDYSEARNNLAYFLFQEGKYDEALVQCQKALENVSYATPERAYANMALIYEKKKDWTKAEEMHKKALIHNKKFVFSLMYLGKSAYEKRDYPKAKEFLSGADEACLASPKGSWGAACAESQYNLALTLLQMKNTPEAVTAFQHCLMSDSTGEFKGKCEKSLQIYQR